MRKKTRFHLDDYDKKYLIFRLGNQYFGTPLLAVNEVIRPLEITPVASDIPFFKGAINLRGEVVAIMDLRELFNIDTAYGPDTSYLIFYSSRGIIGVVVDRIHCIMTFQDESFQKNQVIDVSQKFSFIKGIARTESYLVTIIDLELLVKNDATINICELEEKMGTAV
ncbi:MAG: purine-binding chemotaxis protein CheW [Oligoflexia bacterium]|nr:purine-binding chemotaxis protein CheW [Oligoflexia bacterium]MBF0366276.1 purine-binding chemotaxis protein CheW [Oligoflexia bacterium]